MTDQTLFQTGPQQNEPPTVQGYGPVPAPYVRDFVTRPDIPIDVRRLFTDPAGNLVSMETSARDFTVAQREFVKLRDQWCQTPYCGAPIMQVDHINPHSRGGPTSLANAQGLCEACNQAKADRAAQPQAPPPVRRRPPDFGYPCRRTVLHYHHRRRRSLPSTAPA